MPQFDISYFSSQIFWLLVCFATIYFLAKKIFMPRITSILVNRSNRIDQLNLEVEKLNIELSEINHKIELVRGESMNQYSKIISEAKLRSNNIRSEFIRKNQIKISNLQSNSDLLMQDILTNYSNDSTTAVDDLVKKISDRLISKKIN
tara:strand:+ start:3146 stop:3589 length:444 start_codon:yes stop_codon:yes gene_type:complete